MARKMKVIMACLILGSLFGLIPPSLPAQQHQSPQYSAQEFETLKKRVLELEKQLQTVENVEKLELQAKLADANAKLANAEFGKLERDLRDSHNEWLIKWSILILTLLTAVGAVLWFWLKSRTNHLITDEVEKNLNGFKEGLNRLDRIESRQAVSMLENFYQPDLGTQHSYAQDHVVSREEAMREISEEILLDIYRDEGKPRATRDKAAGVLARKSPPLVSPVLEILNTAVSSDSIPDSERVQRLRNFVNLLGGIHTQEAYHGLTELLNHLLAHNSRHSELFLTWTVFALAGVSDKLTQRDSVRILKKAIPNLNLSGEDAGPIILARCFDKFDEPEGIEEILTNHESSIMSDAEEECLKLLKRHNPAFVENWRAQHNADNAESS